MNFLSRVSADSTYAQTARILPALLVMTLLGGCSTSPNGRLQVTAPAPISNAYSDVDMRLSLATTGNINKTCEAESCTLDQQFDQQVQHTGNRLAEAADVLFPTLNDRVGNFEFVVADKSKPGSTSNARGKVVIFRGVQQLQLNDTALAFLLAREMGHVIGQHHAENSATRIVIAVLAGVLFPASNLFNTTAATQTAFSSTAATTAASSATSYIGSKLALDNVKPEQSSEADFIALGLLEHLGWKPQDVATAIAALPPLDTRDSWAEDFSVSVTRLEALNDSLRSTALVAKQEIVSAPETNDPKLGTVTTENNAPGINTEPPGLPVPSFSNTTNTAHASADESANPIIPATENTALLTFVATNHAPRPASIQPKTAISKPKKQTIASLKQPQHAAKNNQHIATRANGKIQTKPATKPRPATLSSSVTHREVSTRRTHTPVLAATHHLKKAATVASAPNKPKL